jgi:hopanoid biosynthesis associated radical SAM protein HpnH
MAAVVSYLIRKKIKGEKRYPLVLMLDPLYRCNLACAGCGKIQYPANVLKTELSVEECMRAVDECGVPIVSIPGGEPLLHPEIDAIVRGLVERKKYVYLCTNALLLEEKLHLFEPSKYLSFAIHLDGLEEEHDVSVCREGTYRKARRAIELALERGFRVTTNSTFFSRTDPARVRAFFDEMMELGVEGMQISPGYSYEKAPDQGDFLERERTKNLFRELFGNRNKSWRFNQSPLFLEFLAGARDYDCTPWGNPTYSVFGWQRPCYLLQEGYAETFDDLMAQTDWTAYGPKSGNPKCHNCMVHSGFEPSAVDEGFSSLRGFLAMVRAALFGPRIPAVTADPRERELADAEEKPAFVRGDCSHATPEVLRGAFDYRGDVTLTLADGSEIEGYVANLHNGELDLWLKGTTRVQKIAMDAVCEVSFTGRDAASGRSWQTWVRKQEEKRLAEGRGDSAR